ncbi:PAS domain S-box protein [bacterium]|nr:PAS domain S-box protein [bacterium]
MSRDLESLLQTIADRLTGIETRLSLLEGDDVHPESIGEAGGTDSFFRQITETTSDIIVEAYADGYIEFISQSVQQLGYSPSELIGTNGFELIHPDDLLGLQHVLSQLPDARHTTTTSRVRNSQGDYVDFECRINFLDTGDPHSIKVIVVARDVRPRQEFIRQLQDSVKEKEVLLKEIHHRVKNNLQIISSMLNIQSHYFGDPRVKDVFKECQNRIKSMALIHETLYMSKNLANIEFSGYIKNLVQRLSTSYREASGKVSVTLSIPDVTLHIDTAVACGLIVNELVTNSFKHGFPGDHSGTIWITLTGDGDHYCLSVRDNGVGFPKDIDLSKSNSMGLQLVTTLSHQLNADLEFDKMNGTCIALTFSDPDLPEHR